MTAALRRYLRTRLIAFWPCQEVGGVTRVNAVNPGTLDLPQTGGVTQVAGPNAGIPYATKCSAGQFVGLASSAGLNPGQVFSYAGLCYVATPGTDATELMYLRLTAGPLWISRLEWNGSPLACLQMYNQANPANLVIAANQAGTFPNDSAWHSWAVTCDGVQIRQYLDSVQIGGFYLPGPIPAGACDLYICNDGSDVNAGVLALANLGFWKRQLTQGEIVQLHNGGAFLPWPY